MKNFFLCLALALSSGISLSAQEDTLFNTREVYIETPAGKVYGELMLPDTARAMPVVLFVAGSGPNDRDGNSPGMTNNSRKMLAEDLYRAGIASLRFDKRGIGASRQQDMQEADLRFEHFIDDVQAWIGWLRESGLFSAITVAGHSEGSLLGMIAARKSGADKFISIAGAGSPAGKILREQFAAQPKFISDLAMPLLDSLEQGETVSGVPPILSAVFRPSVQPYLISWMRYDPVVEMVALDIPVLIIQGSTDLQVSVAEAEKLHAAARHSELVVIEGMNHTLKDAPADRMANLAVYNKPDLPLSGGFSEAIVAFVRR